MEKNSPGLRQAYLLHDFLSETTEDTEEESYYVSPQSILSEVTPLLPLTLQSLYRYLLGPGCVLFLGD